MPLAATILVCALFIRTAGEAALFPQGRGTLPQTQPRQAPPPPDSQPQPSKPAPEQEAKPEPAPAPENPAPNSTQTQPEAPEAGSMAKPEGKARSAKSSKRGRKHKNSTQSTTGPTRRVVRNGSTSDPTVQIAPRVSQQQASQERQNVDHLLATTAGNLQKLSSRQLSATQQEVVKQIRMYMDQAKDATGAGDLQRAQNLASKARLLSDELVRH